MACSKSHCREEAEYAAISAMLPPNPLAGFCSAFHSQGGFLLKQEFLCGLEPLGNDYCYGYFSFHPCGT